MTFFTEFVSVLALLLILTAGWIGCMVVTWRRDNRKLRQGRLEFDPRMKS
jgi:hypothetical protein